MKRDELLQSIELLKKLVYGPTATVFSGGSLQLLLSRLQNDVMQVPEGKEGVLVRHWERNLPKFQAMLFEQAETVALTPRSHPAFIEGPKTVFVTEHATGAAFDLCPPPPKLP